MMHGQKNTKSCIYFTYGLFSNAVGSVSYGSSA